jgi:hypothetical protein
MERHPMISILERSAVGNLEDLENPGGEIISILNVAEEVEVNLPRVKHYKISFKEWSAHPRGKDAGSH